MLTRAISYVATSYAHRQVSVRISADGRRMGRLSRVAKLQRIRRILRNARKRSDVGATWIARRAIGRATSRCSRLCARTAESPESAFADVIRVGRRSKRGDDPLRSPLHI